MDGDTIDDSVSGIVASDLALHGVAKIDDLQTAIINKDVMLSGISSQSPVSSAPSMTAVTMPTASASSLSAALSTTLGDNIFFGLQSLGMTNLMSELARPGDASAGLLSQVLSNASQSQSASNQTQATTPQLFLAAAAAAAAGAQPAGAISSTVPVQHILIPVSTNGVQQLLSVPLSLTSAGQTANTAIGQMQLVTTPNGQFLSTNVGPSPVNIAMPSTTVTGSSMQPLFVVVPPVNALGSLIMPPNAATIAQNAAAAAAQSLALQQLTQQQTSPASGVSLSQMPQILANAQGQIVAIGSPQLLQQALLAASSNNAAAASVGAKLVACLPAGGASQQANVLLSSPQLQLKQSMVSSSGAAVSTSRPAQAASSSTATVTHTSNGQVASITHITPNINQLLPNTISSTREGTVVDGVNLDEMREFAKQFKIRRLSLGLTQTQVGQALSVTEGPSYSQSAICRFEKLDITPKSAQKIKPVLERWMAMAEERYKNGAQNLSDFIGLEPSKKRKRRTSFTPQALEVLNDYFDRNTHPSGTEMTDLADKLNFDREVIRVWFCNKRQTLKNSVKKLKGPSPPIT